eukprot:TRINITY_DN2594_c0_g2_i1.p1 TRINITY_DN2594_c0_g2~~TRINITY_DN2594_c0_g2_i1.p1  ORF type:complete len:167 (-),score=13.70 TRINITY_DN2594_c0_g2_i1:19-519(-)
MTTAAAHSRKVEESRDGLVIIKGRYGDLDRRGGYLDVTIPLQAKVEDSRLIVAGRGSKESLEGFYDVSFGRGGPKRLQVIYKLGDVVHETTVEDDEDLVIPQADHVIPAEELEQDRLAQIANKVSTPRSRVRVGRVLLGVAAIAGVFFLYKNKLWPFAKSFNWKNK